MDKLPRDCLELIANFVTHVDRARLRATCKFMHDAIPAPSPYAALDHILHTYWLPYIGDSLFRIKIFNHKNAVCAIWKNGFLRELMTREKTCTIYWTYLKKDTWPDEFDEILFDVVDIYINRKVPKMDMLPHVFRIFLDTFK